LRTFVVEVNLDGRSSALARVGARDFLDVEASFAVAGPFVCLLFPSLARGDLDLVGDHKDGIESDAELADEVGVLAGISRKLRKEVFGASFMPMPVSETLRILLASSSSRSMRGESTPLPTRALYRSSVNVR
jgi:hypothetical protein